MSPGQKLRDSQLFPTFMGLITDRFPFVSPPMPDVWVPRLRGDVSKLGFEVSTWRCVGDFKMFQPVSTCFNEHVSTMVTMVTMITMIDPAYPADDEARNW